MKVSDYAGFLLPCMAAGARYGSVYTLARAGLLSGRRYAFERAAFPEGSAELTRKLIEAVAR